MKGFDMSEERAYGIIYGKVTHTMDEYATALRMGACLLRRMIYKPPDVAVWDGNEPYIAQCPHCGETIEDPTAKPPRSFRAIIGASHCPYCGGAIDFTDVTLERYQERREAGDE